MDHWGCKGKQQSKRCCLLLYPGVKDNLHANKESKARTEDAVYLGSTMTGLASS